MAVLCISACDNEATNPGDYELKSSLELVPELTSTGGFTAVFSELRSKDTTYTYPKIITDTLRDEEGTPIIGQDGILSTKSDTLWQPGNITAHFTEYNIIELPSKADTFTISLKSNAQWKAPVPSSGGKVQWYYNYNLITGSTSTSGGGDGYVFFRVSRNRGRRRAIVAVQDIMTNDSTQLIRLRFVQKGERDTK